MFLLLLLLLFYKVQTEIVCLADVGLMVEDGVFERFGWMVDAGCEMRDERHVLLKMSSE